MMGYFLDYDKETCWYCGKTECSGDHRGRMAEEAGRKIIRDKTGRHLPGCPCLNCKPPMRSESERNIRG